MADVEMGDYGHDEYGPLADPYLDRDIKSLEQKGSDRLGYTIVCMFFCFIPLLLFRSCSQIFFFREMGVRHKADVFLNWCAP